MVIRIVNLYISKIFSCTSSSPATNNDSTSSYIPEQHTYTTGDKKMLRKEAQWKLREATYNKEVRFDGKKRRYRNEKQMLLFITKNSIFENCWVPQAVAKRKLLLTHSICYWSLQTQKEKPSVFPFTFFSPHRIHHHRTNTTRHHLCPSWQPLFPLDVTLFPSLLALPSSINQEAIPNPSLHLPQHSWLASQNWH